METIRTHCPSCHKLYSVDPHLIKSSQPQFECLSCQARFFFSFPYAEVLDRYNPPREIELVEIPQVEIIEPVFTGQKQCPKCGVHNDPEATECKSCFIVFSKFLAWKKEGEHWLHLNQQVSDSWRQVLNDYDSKQKHQQFFECCISANELPVAARHYQRMLDLNPHDEIASDMRRRLTEFVSAPLQLVKRRKWPSWRNTGFSAVIIIGIILTATGFSLTWAHNMIGIGVSLILTAVAGRIYFRYLI